jgi:plasmid stabilization system protein ParE
MKPFGFHPEARSEFHQSALYYESPQIGLGRRFVEAVRDAIARIRTQPLLFRETEPGIRRCRTLRFPYGVIYRLKGGAVEVLAVMHLSRKPGYWKHRQ